MYPTSEAYKTAIAKNVRDVKITGTITLKDDTIINITDEDIVLGSLYFTEQCVSGEDIEIGNVYASELGLTLTSPPENPYSLDGARIIINYGINVEPDPEEDPIWEYVPLGYFYVTEIERKQTTVNLKALDGMILFDVDLSGVLTTGTPYSLVQSCCTKAGVILATSSGDFADFANGLSPFTVPDESKIETCRDLIMWVCQITGTFARMNRMGQLEVVPITSGASVKTITKPERFASDVSDFYVKITKVAMKIGEEEYSQGTAGMTLALEENPLLAGKSEAEINAALVEILDQVTEAEYTPYNVDFAGDPALQAGDWVRLTGVSNINGPEVEYSRNSVAYHPDTGAEVPADTPIYVDFAGGRKGSLMVEGVKQELANAALEWDGATLPGWMMPDPSGMSYAGYNIGEARVIAGTAGGGTKRVGIYQEAVVSENDVVTLQCLVRKTGLVDEIRLEIGWRYSDGSFLAYDYLNIAPLLTSEFQLFTFSAVAPAGTGRVHLRPIWDGMQRTNCEIEAYMPMAQINGTEYALPWHKEGTRANSTKRIVLPEALPQEFGVGVWFKPYHNETGTAKFIFAIYKDPHDANNYCQIYMDAAIAGRIVAAHVRAGINRIVNIRNAYLADTITGIYLEQRATKATVHTKRGSGAIVSTDIAGAVPIENLTRIFVGSRHDGERSANAVFADFVLHDRPEDIDPEGYLSAIPGGGGE